VRCIAAELGADQDLRLLIPKMVKSRRNVYSSKLKPTEVQEILELGEEVLQEPIEERPQEENNNSCVQQLHTHLNLKRNLISIWMISINNI
jgi:hypothetical protein